MENIYKVIKKTKRDQPFWDDSVLLVIATSYANAEDKAKNIEPKEAEIHSIQVCGETTSKKDVFRFRDR